MKWGGNMRKLLLLTSANIRKTKGHSISLIIMFFIAALLLNSGLLVLVNFTSFYEELEKELNTSNTYFVMPDRAYTTEVEEYIANHDSIISMQKEEPLWGLGLINYKGDTREIGYLINDTEITRSLSKWKFIGEHLPLEDRSIYLPCVFQQDAGYQLDDKFELILKDQIITFIIKGFVEDISFSSLETGLVGMYVSHSTFEDLSEYFGNNEKASLIYANVKESNKEIEKGIKKLTGLVSASLLSDTSNTIVSYDSTMIKMARTMMADGVASTIVAFAAIIVIVCLIVVRFRIGNSIEDEMTKIGALKAIGYTSRQIVASIVLQFKLLALVGSALGIVLSSSTTAVLSDVLVQQSGLRWVQGFDGIISGITLFAILLFVGFISLITAGRINKLHPIIALRGGIITHSFKKNHVPLHSSIGNLPLVLALKSLLQNKKQSIMITIVMIAVSFAGSFAVLLFYNSTINTRSFLEIPGVELSNVSIVLNPQTDTTEYVNNIKEMNEVRKVQFIDQEEVNIDGDDIIVYVMEDYKEKETNTIYEGRYPLHRNEIVLAGRLSELLNKTIGDIVTVQVGNHQSEFLVTGLSQGAFMGGINASITLDGMKQLNPNFKPFDLQIYLKENENSGEFMEKLKAIYGDRVALYVDMDKTMEQGAGAYSSIISKVGIAVLAITILVVILVLYFVINSSVTRRRRELGIQKAVGFTTFQLMNQLSISFLLPIIFGVIIGCILGIRQMNPVLSVAQRGMSVMKTNYVITPGLVALFGIAIVIEAYITSMMITYRIRKISAYALVCE